jgi:hypothetical protein
LHNNVKVLNVTELYTKTDYSGKFYALYVFTTVKHTQKKNLCKEKSSHSHTFSIFQTFEGSWVNFKVWMYNWSILNAISMVSLGMGGIAMPLHPTENPI